MGHLTATLRAEVIRLMGETSGTESMADREMLVDRLIESAREDRPLRTVQLVG